ncbi:receptor/non-receptor type protein-tyrosine phosphatase [Piedraia hortae CBS 480.64]|uniref:Receptor/non-receptor type protein-tyrosine phosphatase n=1 Tax=Piedraia hortae CBS 480.64 TaxID=1314780 RepID=A0A6A7C651_9PEZI|nr:receptor/non-receptor type protein-tyrosine phosphatase [Piedraia hortae CBS 480.64]
MPPQLPNYLLLPPTEIHSQFRHLEHMHRERHSCPQGRWTLPSTTPNRHIYMSRNRYENVEPYLHNRILLGGYDDPSSPQRSEVAGDYINASQICLGSRSYIAAQGPTASTAGHFWRMVAHNLPEEREAVIVMLTQLRERGREKCFPYFLGAGGGDGVGSGAGGGRTGEVAVGGGGEAEGRSLRPRSAPSPTTPQGILPIPREENDPSLFEAELHTLSTSFHEASKSEVRRLRLRYRSRATKGEWRYKEVNHLFFSAWPDFQVPKGEDREALVELVGLAARVASPTQTTKSAGTKTAKRMSTPSSLGRDLVSYDGSPRVIHCSAGVGRTGTFMALDSLLTRLYSGELDCLPQDCNPVWETVLRLREQRMMMVQTLDQLLLIYHVLRERWVERSRHSN